MDAGEPVTAIGPIGSEVRARFERDGFLIMDELIDPALVPTLHRRFEALFRGEFETGIAPDEVNWLEGRDDPGLTRQICNGWRPT